MKSFEEQEFCETKFEKSIDKLIFMLYNYNNINVAYNMFMQAWFSGKASASQAEEAGSIPVACSKKQWGIAQMRQPRLCNIKTTLKTQ